MFDLDLQSRVPIYEQLVLSVSRMVMLGALKRGEQLPTVRSLATRLGINPNTVAKAYQILEQQKIIGTVSGKGSFISSETGTLKTLAEKPFEAAAREAAAAGLDRASAERIVAAVFSGTSGQVPQTSKQEEGHV